MTNINGPEEDSRTLLGDSGHFLYNRSYVFGVAHCKRLSSPSYLAGAVTGGGRAGAIHTDVVSQEADRPVRGIDAQQVFRVFSRKGAH